MASFPNYLFLMFVTLLSIISSLYSLRSLELPVNPSRKCIMSSFGYSTSLCGICCYGSWSTVLLYVHWSCTNDFKEGWREACVDSRCFILHVSLAAVNWFSYFYLHIFKYLTKLYVINLPYFSFYFRFAVIPVILCPGLGSIFACGLVFGCGVIYGMMGLGKK